MSFARLVQRFKEGMTVADTAPDANRLHLATAAVLLEIANADGAFSPSEDGDIVSYLRRAFQLTDADARELIGAAAEIRDKLIDHFALTNFIRRNASLEDRVEIVKTMWRVASSDGKVTDYEGHLVRKLADLLGLEHHVMIETKVAVLNERR